MKLLGALVMAICAALAQAPDLKSASGYPKMVQRQVTAWIERAAEKMPEEEYGFKPDPAARSFGQILGHVAEADHLFCSAVLGDNSPPTAIEKTKSTKAELTSALHDAFAYCNRAYDTLTDASANETVKSFGQERNRLGVLWFNASHNLEHYGNLVVYMRVKGMVPPSSEPKPLTPSFAASVLRCLAGISLRESAAATDEPLKNAVTPRRTVTKHSPWALKTKKAAC